MTGGQQTNQIIHWMNIRTNINTILYSMEKKGFITAIQERLRVDIIVLKEYKTK